MVSATRSIRALQAIAGRRAFLDQVLRTFDGDERLRMASLLGGWSPPPTGCGHTRN
jgi:hypothetical protein